MAGFPPERGYFHIKRAAMIPPEVLQDRLFASIDHYSDVCDGWERTLAAQGFICLLNIFVLIFCKVQLC